MRPLPSLDTDSDESRPPEEASSSRRHRLAEGTEGGLVATLVLTAYRLPVSHALPPTAEFWSKFVAGGDSADHTLPALVLHLLYGAGAGALFGALFPAREPRETVGRELTGLLLATGYALALSVFGERVVLGRLLDMDLEADESLVFHVGHLVYGLTLGTWLGSRTSAD
ncbi:hypothetical protein [Halorussus ruber]|uniref:hypothetical protein n=1 Tax=Halorussus ruber TaxID=1126238 RepID=UPI0010931134|nr:hypothetical protein [Halorussus ruber]